MSGSAVDVVFHRLDRRTNNPFGITPAERERIADDIAKIDRCSVRRRVKSRDVVCEVVV